MANKEKKQIIFQIFWIELKEIIKKKLNERAAYYK